MGGDAEEAGKAVWRRRKVMGRGGKWCLEVAEDGGERGSVGKRRECGVWEGGGREGLGCH